MTDIDPERRHDASSGPLETGADDRTEAEIRDRDPGDSADRLSPETSVEELEDRDIAADDVGATHLAQEARRWAAERGDG